MIDRGTIGITTFLFHRLTIGGRRSKAKASSACMSGISKNTRLTAGGILGSGRGFGFTTWTFLRITSSALAAARD
jgi:hypothetical protein